MKEQRKQTMDGRIVNSQSCERGNVRRLVCLIGVYLLVNAALASTGLNYLVPSVMDGREGIAASVDWYLRSGQLQADARTLAAALDYILSSNSNVPATTNLAVLTVADDVAPMAPKSWGHLRVTSQLVASWGGVVIMATCSFHSTNRPV